MRERGRAGTLRRRTILYRRIVIVMNGGFAIAIGLMLAGILIGAVTGDRIAAETTSIRQTLPGALRLNAQDIVELGIFVLLATPAAYVVVALLTFVRDRDPLYILVCLALLGIVSVSVGVSMV